MDGGVVAAWVGGLLMGWFVVLHFVIVGKGVGGSSGYACLVEKAKSKTIFLGHLDPLKLFFMIGLPLGGLLHVLVSGEGFSFTFDMGMYEAVLPESDVLKVMVLALGGTFLGLGARLAGGCTSGHALGGAAILNKSSMVAAVLFFATATLTGQLLFSQVGMGIF